MKTTNSKSSDNRVRIQSLDYLRGLMALAVMGYHYTIEVMGPLDSSSVLSRLGIYAVSLFYILSGVSLGIVYIEKVKDIGDIAEFAVRRIYRIVPVYYIAVITALLFEVLSSIKNGTIYQFPVYKAVLNFTLVFGFIDPTAYLSTGAWSIGNEIVFYTIFSAVLFCGKKSLKIIYGMLLISFVSTIYISFVTLSSKNSLAQQWGIYINPFNQIYLFFSGVLISRILKPAKQPEMRFIAAITSVICLALFGFLPASGNQINLVTGANRLVFSATCIAFVAAVFIWNPSSQSNLLRPLAFLGEGCYSIYLLHPLIAIPISYVFVRMSLGSPVEAYLAAALATLLVSWISFRVVEQPMITMGRRVGEGLARRVCNSKLI